MKQSDKDKQIYKLLPNGKAVKLSKREVKAITPKYVTVTKEMLKNFEAILAQSKE